MKIKKGIFPCTDEELRIGDAVKIVTLFASEEEGLFFNPNMVDELYKVQKIINIRKQESGYTWYDCGRWTWLRKCLEKI